MLNPKREPLPNGQLVETTLSNVESQLLNSMTKVDLIPSQKRRNGGFGFVAILNGFIYHVDYQREGTAGARVYWKCTQRGGCGARIITDKDGVILNARNNFHTHSPLEEGNENKLLRPGRARSFNYQTNLALVREIAVRKHVLFGANETLTPQEKAVMRECAWEEIRKSMAAQGHTKFSGKDWKVLRAHGWRQARQTALSKKFLNMVPGAKHVPLDELDEIVLAIVGNDSLYDTENIDDLTQIDTTKDEMDSHTVSTSPSLSNEPISTLALLNSIVANISENAADNRNDAQSVDSLINGQAQSPSPKNPFDEFYSNHQFVLDAETPPTPTSQSDIERERVRVQLVHDRTKLMLLEKQIAQEQELHQLRVEVERANLRHAVARAAYEEERLKLLRHDNVPTNR